MPEISVRIYVLDERGVPHDNNETFGLESFAGQVPQVGDVILDPGVLQHLNRELPENRTFWTVTKRVFNPRDLKDYIALVVKERAGTAADRDFIG